MGVEAGFGSATGLARLHRSTDGQYGGEQVDANRRRLTRWFAEPKAQWPDSERAALRKPCLAWQGKRIKTALNRQDAEAAKTDERAPRRSPRPGGSSCFLSRFIPGRIRLDTFSLLTLRISLDMPPHRG